MKQTCYTGLIDMFSCLFKKELLYQQLHVFMPFLKKELLYQQLHLIIG